MNFGEFKDGKAPQALTPTLAPHEAELYHFQVRCHELCLKILRLLALGLKVCISIVFGERRSREL